MTKLIGSTTALLGSLDFSLYDISSWIISLCFAHSQNRWLRFVEYLNLDGEPSSRWLFMQGQQWSLRFMFNWLWLPPSLIIDYTLSGSYVVEYSISTYLLLHWYGLQFRLCPSLTLSNSCSGYLDLDKDVLFTDDCSHQHDNTYLTRSSLHFLLNFLPEQSHTT